MRCVKMLVSVFLMVIVCAYSVLGMKATSSSGQDAYVAANAIDGNMGTRWSSQFSDDEWWQVEFDEPRILAGMRLRWETAYGEKYRIELGRRLCTRLRYRSQR